MTWETLLIVGSLFGLAYGFLFQKGDFCFVAAFRDYFGYKDTRVLTGIVAAVTVTLLGAALIITAGGMDASQLWVVSGGWTSIIGGFIFGVAMYVAGSCATGTLYRCGMGYVHFWVVLFSMGVGYLVFAQFYDPHIFTVMEEWTTVEATSLYDVLGLPILATALLVVGALVAFLGIRMGFGNLVKEVRAIFGFFKQHPLALLKAKSWDARAVGLLLGTLVLIQLVVWTSLGVTAPETRIAATLAGGILGEHFVLANPYLGRLFDGYPRVGLGPTELMIIFMIVGASLASLAGGSFRVRKPRLERMPTAIGGGIVMGIASRITPGCNVANILSGVPALSFHSILAAVGLVGGVFVAQFYDQWRIDQAIRKAQEEAEARAAAEAEAEAQAGAAADAPGPGRAGD